MKDNKKSQQVAYNRVARAAESAKSGKISSDSASRVFRENVKGYPSKFSVELMETYKKGKSGGVDKNQYSKGGKMKKAKTPMMKYGGKMGKKSC
jgi:hypothetical protein